MTPLPPSSQSDSYSVLVEKYEDGNGLLQERPIQVTDEMAERAAMANFAFIKAANDWDLGEWDRLDADTQAFHRRQVLAVLGAALEESA